MRFLFKAPAALLFTLLLSSCGRGSPATEPSIPDRAPDARDDHFAVNPAVRDANRAWVHSCLAHMPLNKTAAVDSEVHELCRKPDLYYSAPVHYRISNDGKKLKMEFKIHFKISPANTSLSRAKEMLAVARACMPQVASMWSRYDVEFNIAMDSDREPQPDNGLPAQDVNLVDENGRSDAGTFYVQPSDMLCVTMAHETGHHLSLEDEYEDANCPDRPFVSQETNPYSIMAYIWGSWDNLEFYDRHLKSIFAAYCGQAEPARAVMPEKWVNLGLPR